MAVTERIKVCWDEVETACERNAPGLHSYLDRASGAVLVAVDGDPEDEETRRLIAAAPQRFLLLQPASPRAQYEWMEAFVATVAEQGLRDRLLVATDGRGAFRRFKDTLLDHPAERERWFSWRGALLHAHIRGWFAQQGLDPDPPCPWEDQPPPVVVPRPREAALQRALPVMGLRQQLCALVDILPSGELHAARAFLEYLRDRGAAELDPTRGRLDPHRPFRRRSPAMAGYGDHEPEREVGPRAPAPPDAVEGG